MKIPNLILLYLYGLACIGFNSSLERITHDKTNFVDKILGVTFILVLFLLFSVAIRKIF